MAILLRKIKSLNTKKTLSIVLSAGIVALVISSPFASAQGPAFNIFPICYTPTLNCDLPLLDAKNIIQGGSYSTSQADHDDGIQANAGDIIELSVYYHNGAANTEENIALHTLIQAFASPILESSASIHTMSATISAQNAPTVSSAQKGGDMDIHIEGGIPQSLSLVPGSVILYPDRGLVPQPAPQTLPDTIFTSGVDIGSVRGCFEFHGFVNFRVRVSEVQPGSFAIHKQVRNQTSGGDFSDTEVSAEPGQTVEYRIRVSASGNPITNVFVKDVLDDRLTFNNTLLLDSQVIDSAGFFSSEGVNIGTVNTTIIRELRFSATVAGASHFPIGTTILPNLATAFITFHEVSDGANVRVVIPHPQITCIFTWQPPVTSDGRGIRRVGEIMNVRMQVSGLGSHQNFHIVHQHISGFPIFQTSFTANAHGQFDLTDVTTVIEPAFATGNYHSFVEVGGVFVAACRGFRIEPPVVQQIEIDKTVRNDVTGGDFVEQVDAQPSQGLTFRLVISIQQSTVPVPNVVVRDSLPARMTFVPGSFNLNGTFQSEGNFFSSGLDIGTLDPNQTVTITFQADVKDHSHFTTGTCEILTNTGTVNCVGTLTDTDSAFVRVCRQPPQKQPGTPGSRP